MARTAGRKVLFPPTLTPRKNTTNDKRQHSALNRIFKFYVLRVSLSLLRRGSREPRSTLLAGRDCPHTGPAERRKASALLTRPQARGTSSRPYLDRGVLSARSSTRVSSSWSATASAIRTIRSSWVHCARRHRFEGRYALGSVLASVAAGTQLRASLAARRSASGGREATRRARARQARRESVCADVDVHQPGEIRFTLRSDDADREHLIHAR